jgi:glutamate-1-semialdehyde 2,1-aminomutase
VLRYNDVAGLEAAFAARGSEIAGVMLEPVVGNMGLVPPTTDFLAALRSLTTRYGAILVFDEVMTGFRLAYGGAQELFGASPDLTVFGKIIGGGLPVGAYGGRADLMKHVMPAGKVFQAGTLSGNPLATAAGVATLRILRDRPPYDHLEHLGLRLEDGMRDLATAAKIPHQFARVGSMWTFFFADAPVTDYDTARRSDTAKFARFFWSMMDHGIYLPCSQFEAAFLSAVMDESHIDRVLHAAGQAFLSL